jgi:hypothetical protein
MRGSQAGGPHLTPRSCSPRPLPTYTPTPPSRRRRQEASRRGTGSGFPRKPATTGFTNPGRPIPGDGRLTRAGVLRRVGRSVRVLRTLVEELDGKDGVATPTPAEGVATAEGSLDQLLEMRGAEIGAATVRLDADLALVAELGDRIPHASHRSRSCARTASSRRSTPTSTPSDRVTGQSSKDAITAESCLRTHTAHPRIPGRLSLRTLRELVGAGHGRTPVEAAEDAWAQFELEFGSPPGTSE